MELNIRGRWEKFVTGARRILIVSKKPDNAQYMSMARITALGIVVLGIIGFLVEFFGFLIKTFL
jgi:protein transport protein SEC61 subunit gamma-like protein